MEQWIDIAGKFGIPVVMLALLAYFLIKHVWPFVTRQIEDAQAARKVEVDKFVDTIRARDALMAESQRETVKALTAITGELRGLKDAVRVPRK